MSFRFICVFSLLTLLFRLGAMGARWTSFPVLFADSLLKSVEATAVNSITSGFSNRGTIMADMLVGMSKMGASWSILPDREVLAAVKAVAPLFSAQEVDDVANALPALFAEDFRTDESQVALQALKDALESRKQQLSVGTKESTDAASCPAEHLEEAQRLDTAAEGQQTVDQEPEVDAASAKGGIFSKIISWFKWPVRRLMRANK